MTSRRAAGRAATPPADPATPADLAATARAVAIFGVYGWPPLLVMRLATVYTRQSSDTLKRAVRAGQIVAAGRCGRSLSFRREALDAYLTGAPVAAAPSAGVPTAAAATQREVRPARHARRSPATPPGDDLAVAQLRRLAKGGAR